jgi:hypothetical protein
MAEGQVGFQKLARNPSSCMAPVELAAFLGLGVGSSLCELRGPQSPVGFMHAPGINPKGSEEKTGLFKTYMRKDLYLLS